jgi:hypothetical protein
MPSPGSPSWPVSGSILPMGARVWLPWPLLVGRHRLEAGQRPNDHHDEPVGDRVPSRVLLGGQSAVVCPIELGTSLPPRQTTFMVETSLDTQPQRCYVYNVNLPKVNEPANPARAADLEEEKR